MLYNMNSEPGHKDCAADVTHPLADYAPGSPRLERLYEAMEQANKFTFGDGGDVNV